MLSRPHKLLLFFILSDFDTIESDGPAITTGASAGKRQVSVSFLAVNDCCLIVSNTSNGVSLDDIDMFKLDFDERLLMLLFLE